MWTLVQTLMMYFCNLYQLFFLIFSFVPTVSIYAIFIRVNPRGTNVRSKLEAHRKLWFFRATRLTSSNELALGNDETGARKVSWYTHRCAAIYGGSLISEDLQSSKRLPRVRDRFALRYFTRWISLCERERERERRVERDYVSFVISLVKTFAPVNERASCFYAIWTRGSDC